MEVIVVSSHERQVIVVINIEDSKGHVLVFCLQRQDDWLLLSAWSTPIGMEFEELDACLIVLLGFR